MCMTFKMTKKDRDKFIKSLSVYSEKDNCVILYKVVRKRNGNYYPLCFRAHLPIKKGMTNKIEDERGIEDIKLVFIKTHLKTTYRPYFHFYLDKKFAFSDCITTNNLTTCSMDIVLKCSIPKDKITEVGYQHNTVVIVATEYNIVEEEI